MSTAVQLLSQFSSQLKLLRTSTHIIAQTISSIKADGNRVRTDRRGGGWTFASRIGPKKTPNSLLPTRSSHLGEAEVGGDSIEWVGGSSCPKGQKGYVLKNEINAFLTSCKKQPVQ